MTTDDPLTQPWVQAGVPAVLSSLRDAVIITNKAGLISYANEACLEVLGWKPSELIDRDLEILVPDRLLEPHRRAFQAWADNGPTELSGQRLRLPANHKDGHEIEIELVLSPLDVDEDIHGRWMAGIIRDLSDRVTIERRSQLENRLLDLVQTIDFEDVVELEALLETMARELRWPFASVWILDVHTGRYTCEALWADPMKSLNGFIDVTQASTFGHGEGLPGSVAAAGEPLWVDDIRHDSAFSRGSIADVVGLATAIGFPVRDGDSVLAVIELFDGPRTQRDDDLIDLLGVVGKALGTILARRYAEALERLQRERLELAVGVAGIGIWEWDERSGVVTWSPELERMYGLSEGGFGGSFEAYLELIHPDDRDMTMAEIQDVMANDREHRILHRGVRPDGSVVWIDGRGRVRRDADGNVVGMSGVAIDVTEREESRQERERLLEREQRNRARAEAAFLQAREVAEAFQRSLLPPALPKIPTLDLAAAYLASSREPTKVGGDFYDVFPVADGSWLVTMGDVCGKGVVAAALTARIRYAVRAAAAVDASPRSILATVSSTLDHDPEVDGRFCTMMIARLRLTGDGVDVTLGRGGHPPAFVVRADGTVDAKQPAGPLVGVAGLEGWTDETFTLGADDALVLYTDGVIEQRNTAGVFYGEARLKSELQLHAGAAAEEFVGAIESSVKAYSGIPDDDIAVLVVRAVG